MRTTILTSTLALAGLASSQATVFISEVHSTGSSNVTYVADWFELTNNGGAAVDITGWKIDDSSNAFGSALALRGVTSLAPGQSVVFVEGNTSGTTDAAVQAAFITAWFGASAPAGFTIGGYGGSAIGLSSTADAVNIFDAGGTPVTGVTFGAGTLGTSFDNAIGLTGTAISTLSVVGTNGAFTSLTGSEIGSPGAIPEPGSALLLGGGVACLLGLRRRRAV